MTENMSCDAIDVVLSDYLEGTMDPALRQQAEAHVSQCLRCLALVRDLARITAEARLLPDLVPSRDLWKGIDARIAAPVIPLGASHAPSRAASPRRMTPAWMGIAAAALMMSTAGVTYFLTARTMAPASVASGTVQPALSGVQPSDIEVTPDGSGEAELGNAGIRTMPAVVMPPETRSIASFASATSQVRDAQTDVVYGREIEMLQQIVRRRKTQLDSSTVAIIERNLKVIDAAIEQSRAALARDPASSSLSDQLTRVLDKKVELLRTAALLPAST